MAKKLTRKEKIALQQQNRQAGTEKPPVKKNDPRTAKKTNTLKRNLALIIAALAFLLYANTLGHQFTRDDYSAIKENTITKKGSSAIGEIVHTTYRSGWTGNDYELYRPLSKIVFALEWGFSPDDPQLGHFIHVVFYALSGFLLFYALSLYLNGNLLIAFLASSIFVAHPIHTEVGASIKSLDELLS